MNKPTTVSQMFPSKWLKATDLNGRHVILTITAVTIEKIHNPRTRQEEWKAIMDFGRSKRLVLNKTQCESMAQITNSETFTDWTGYHVMIAPGKSHNGKDTIHISRPPQPQPTPQPTTTGAAIANNGDASAEVACEECGEIQPAIMCYPHENGFVCAACYRSEEE